MKLKELKELIKTLDDDLEIVFGEERYTGKVYSISNLSIATVNVIRNKNSDFTTVKKVVKLY